MAKSFGTPLSAEPGTEPSTETKAAKAPKAKTAPVNQPEPETETETNVPDNTPAHSDLLAELEARNVYGEAGPLYGAVNHIGDLGCEIGIHTGKGKDKQRAGIGVYVRVDHIAKRFASKEIMDLLD